MRPYVGTYVVGTFAFYPSKHSKLIRSPLSTIDESSRLDKPPRPPSPADAAYGLLLAADAHRSQLRASWSTTTSAARPRRGSGCGFSTAPPPPFSLVPASNAASCSRCAPASRRLHRFPLSQPSTLATPLLGDGDNGCTLLLSRDHTLQAEVEEMAMEVGASLTNPQSCSLHRLLPKPNSRPQDHVQDYSVVYFTMDSLHI
jgi:hypothetical protein